MDTEDNKEVDTSDEARTVAVLRGNWMAKHLPDVWRAWMRGEYDHLQQDSVMIKQMKNRLREG